jgi:demethylmenaquinone methyltransferase/2-methoxy-6-polyprenyl-1,4-benzoquinol methylase
MNHDAEMRTYYNRRASEYERSVYSREARPERQAELASLKRDLQRQLAGRDVLELACGTGYWTEVIAPVTPSIFAIDQSLESLEIARAKKLPSERVQFGLGDAYAPALAASAAGPFTAGFAAFWWSHVPRSRLEEFLRELHAALAPRARVVFVDNCFVAGHSTPISRTDADGNTYQLRKLEGGGEFEVLKNFPDDLDLRDAIGPERSMSATITRYRHFWMMEYRV